MTVVDLVVVVVEIGVLVMHQDLKVVRGKHPAFVVTATIVLPHPETPVTEEASTDHPCVTTASTDPEVAEEETARTVLVTNRLHPAKEERDRQVVRIPTTGPLSDDE